MPQGSQGGSAPIQVKEIAFYDTISAANFQGWWQTYANPKYKADSGIVVKYSPSQSAEVLDRIKAWSPGKGDIDVLLLAQDKFAEYVKADLLEPLDPLNIANLSKAEPPDNKEAAQVPVANKGVPFVRYQYVLAVNTDVVKSPPQSFKQLFERRAEFKGKISYVDPRSPVSGAGRFFVAGFLRAFGCDFGFAPDGKENATWGPAWEKLKELEKFVSPKHAQSGGEHAGQFSRGEIAIGNHAFDFIEYSKQQGTLPPTVKSIFVEEGLPGGANYLAIPKGLTAERRNAAASFLNFAISDDVEVNMVEKMYEFPGTNVWDKLSKKEYDIMPTRDVYAQRRMPDVPLNSLKYITDTWAAKVGYGG